MRLLANGWKLYRQNFSVILGLVLTIGLPCQMLLSYLSYRVLTREEALQNMAAALLIDCIFGVVISGGILHALFITKLQRKAGYLECLSASISNWAQLAWTNLLIYSLAIIGLLGFVLPGLIVLVRLCLSTTIVMTEGLWGAAALQRGVQLTADRSWKVSSLALMLYLPLQMAGWIGVPMLLTIPSLDRWQIAGALGVLLTLAGGLMTTCLYSLYEEFMAEESREV